jgi:hypothetical protein
MVGSCDDKRWASPPPSFPEDFQSEWTKLLKAALEEAAGAVSRVLSDVIVMASPCLNERTAWQYPECQGPQP